MPRALSQREAVTASLEGDCNALDPASCFLRFLSPSMQQLQQCARVDHKLFQRLTLDARYDTGNEPARQAHLNDRNQHMRTHLIHRPARDILPLLVDLEFFSYRCSIWCRSTVRI